MRNKNQKGFTLIELLVVIAIIGLLASVVLLALSSARQKSRDAKRLADIRQLASALELYFNDNSRYPTGAEFATGTTSGGTVYVAPDYIGQVPTAPAPNDGTCTALQNTYTYTQTSSGASYTLTFCLGAITGGTPAGTHTLSPSGIQ